MTDADIAASKHAHYQQTLALRRLVHAGTPSRVAWVFDVAGTVLGLWDYVTDKKYRRRR